jgi:myo-inositol catabolism protein IolC
MDPISAMATASAAFNTIKKGFAVGRDIEQMASDLGRWMGALSDLEQAEKEAKNPPIFKKLFAGSSVEQEAMEAFAAKTKAEKQREELKTWIQYTMGQSKWDELIRMEADIRKQRKETLYRQRERRQKFVEIVVIILAVITGIGILAGLVYWGMARRGMV